MAIAAKTELDHQRLPQQFGPFLLDKAIWRGAHSCVYYAMDLRDQTPVALKVLYAQPDCSLERQQVNAELEASRLRDLTHPHIVELRQHSAIDAVPYLSFPYIDGAGLDQAVKRTLVSVESILECMLKVCRALHYAHGKGIIHRDLKPRNIMLARSGEPVVLDWGLSWRKSSAHESGIQQIVGTPAYMSPEQARGAENTLTPASDVYSLGAILYHLLTGRAPFEADTAWKTLQMAMSLPPAPPAQLRPDLDPRIERILLTCLEKHPNKRYPTAESLAANLERVLSSQR